MGIINPGFYNNIKIDNSKIEQDLKKLNKQVEVKGKSFGEILNEKTGSQELKFSAHAQKRINSRNINMNAQELEKIQTGINKIKEKGGNDSVVLVDTRAYVVSAKNNTVVTVIDSNSLKENVFTNIDSMVIM